jgi:DMSO/TMAO reductase YedYZ molybdopterin-dependent catalytic subunit
MRGARTAQLRHSSSPLAGLTAQPAQLRHLDTPRNPPRAIPIALRDEPLRVTTRLRFALYGVLAALAGTGIGQLVAALNDPASAPVLAVGELVIDHTPTPVKNWAIAHFGTHDKSILVGSVLVGVLVLAGVAGLLARRAFRWGATLLVLLVGVALYAALSRPVVHAVDAVPGIVTGVVGLVVLWALTRLETGRALLPGTDVGEVARPSRRGVLLGAAAVATVATGSGYAGRLIAHSRAAIGNIALPRPRSAAPPWPKGLDDEVRGITPFRTSNADFYRVDTRLSLPIVDVSSWSLTIDGDVKRQQTFSFDDLLAMPLIERDITLTCVSNDVGGPYVGGARWLGVRLTDLLDRAGVGGTADQILSTDVDGMTISTPLALATDGRDAMIAVGMNGEPLPRAHGFPARMVVPGLYGFISACKWISRMTLTTYAADSAYWTDRHWATDAPIKIASRIDTPNGLHVTAGRTFIGGIAWAQPVGVATVEVQIDGGPWQKATLGPSAGHDYWRQWYLHWDAKPGSHQIASRATDTQGNVQTAVRATPFPSGASGIQKLVVAVA